MSKIKRMETHSHSHYSNIRLIDSINHPKDMILTAHKLGLSGLVLTDHECLSGHVEWLKLEKELKEKKLIPEDFKCGLGNEIYLIDSRSDFSSFFHFILIAKNTEGHRALRELSSTAWINSFTYRNMERVPTLKNELKEVLTKYPNSVIGTTACLGGELPRLVKELIILEKNNGSKQDIFAKKVEIVNFLNFCKDIFGDDFYIEVAPGSSEDQVNFNKRVQSIAKSQKIKMIFATDSHYLTAEDRLMHKAYLNSKDGDREVDAFYADAHMMSEEETFEKLRLAFSDEDIVEMCNNTMEIYDKIEEYNIFHNPIIPEVDVDNYEKKDLLKDYPILNNLFLSDNIQERFWINQCWEGLINFGFEKDKTYLERLQTEADVIKTIGDKLGNCLFSYFNTFQHYIDLFWDCGSLSGPGRGSSVCFLSNYLMGITQLDPIVWDLPYWRFLNKERVELPDIDTDLSPSKRKAVFEAIRKERGELNLIQVATFGTEGSRSAIQTACRGYSTEEYPSGIDPDTAKYLTSLIPEERGFLWPIKDVVYGNEEKERKPIRAFINEVNKYEGLLDIIISIEGLVKTRSQHASGVILYNNSPFETDSIMRSSSGDLITAYSLHDAEELGDTKFDFLVTEISDKISECLKLMKQNGYFEDCNSLREIYEKHFHPSKIDINNEKIWKSLAEGTTLDVFQFNSDAGLQVAKSIKPKTPIEMTMANALMRLMGEKGEERPQDRYIRLKDDMDLWYQEVTNWGLSEEEIKILEPYYLPRSGVPATQEDLMKVCMDENISHFTLKEANAARKIVAKKQMDKIEELKEKFVSQCPNKNFGEYVWKTTMGPQMG